MKIVIASDAKQPNATYRGALLAAGALPEEVVVVTPGDPDPGAFDGLLLAGGADVAPTLYGEAPGTPTLELHPERDALDFALFSAAEKLGTPVFGICRGLQALNVALGGTLWQDLPSQRARGVSHETDVNPHARKDHPVHVVFDSLEGPLAVVKLARPAVLAAALASFHDHPGPPTSAGGPDRPQ